MQEDHTSALVELAGSRETQQLAPDSEIKKLGKTQQIWTTPGGNMTTNSRVKAQFTIPSYTTENCSNGIYTSPRAWGRMT